MAINLIKNANELVEFKLQGIKLTNKYKTELAHLKSSCIKNLEDKSVKMIEDYLCKQITIAENNTPE